MLIVAPACGSSGENSGGTTEQVGSIAEASEPEETLPGDPSTGVTSVDDTAPAGPESDADESVSIVIPELVGMQESDATELLISISLEDISYIEQPSLGPEGVVINQLPRAGSTYRSGPITLTYSIPLPDMPDVVGMRVGEAESLFRDWGVDVRTELELSDERPDGEVLSSVPSAGERVGSEIQLNVAAAPVAGKLGTEDAPLLDYVINNRSYGSYTNKPAEVNGELYEDSLLAELSRYTEAGDSAYWDYNISRDWNRLEAVVGITDDSTFEQRARFRVVLDGDVIWERDDVGFGEEVPVAIDISGGLRLRLEVVALDNGEVGIAWGAPRLLGIEGRPGSGN